jgi:pyruvate,orthophosphate dikinase
MPRPTAELVRIYGILERHYRDMQDMEFTIETGSSGCSRPAAASARQGGLRIAVELASEG